MDDKWLSAESEPGDVEGVAFGDDEPDDGERTEQGERFFPVAELVFPRAEEARHVRMTE